MMEVRRPFRFYLVLLLTLGLAVGLWPSFSQSEWQTAKLSDSAPTIGVLAELDASDGAGGTGHDVILASGASAHELAEASSLEENRDAPLYHLNLLSHLPEKTGPPTA